MGSRDGERRTGRWRVQAALTPLIEGPDSEVKEEEVLKEKESSWDVIRSWFRARTIHSGGGGGCRSSMDLKLTLGVLGCPLAPVAFPGSCESDQIPSPPPQDVPIVCLSPSLFSSLIFESSGCISDRFWFIQETSSAHYIIQQYLAATGCSKVQSTVKNVYTTGTVRMLCHGTETSNGKNSGSRGGVENGCFVLWHMSPGMWSMELAVAGCKIVAGCNGRIVWRHIPWVGIHAAKGPLRPLRRTVQGLDPKTTATMFTKAQCIGEKRVGEEDCFVLKVSADGANIAERSEGHVEVMRHVLYGYFSQKSGLLMFLEDSHLTRVQPPGADADTVYWETTITSSVEDYSAVDGILVAHHGHSVATVFRFGKGSANNSRTMMEEEWHIDDIVFNVPGLSMDYFIPPAEILNNK